MKFFLFPIFFMLFACSQVEKDTSDFGQLKIIEDSPNKWTSLAKQNLHHLTQVYHLKDYFFEKRIHLQVKPGQHFHKNLILETKYAEFPHHLLSQFLHQEIHFWLKSRSKATTKALKDLQSIYPNAPKEVGQKNNRSSYLHLMICYLEYMAIIHLLGEKESKKIFSHFIRAEKNYSWAYSMVIQKNSGVSRVIRKYHLLPPQQT